ncbi:MAG: ribosome-associated translation inhibitor RaiA, partial [Ruminococcaceae bacterium]|nr:ribosome-associated translation inhibitor RaiA [Oscillospiraceae bacterium]
MNISIIGRQMTVSDDLKMQVERKLARFDKFFPEGADATVTFSRLRDKECLEITISYKGMLLRSEEKNLTFLCALDECVEIIDG